MIGLSAKVLARAGWNTSTYYYDSGQPAGKGVFDPSSHAYVEGQPFDVAAYCTRYGLPGDGNHYVPQIYDENRSVWFPAALAQATDKGWFYKAGIYLDASARGEMPTDEECDDFNFLCPAGLMQDFVRSFGPASHQPETSPAPAKPSPSGFIHPWRLVPAASNLPIYRWPSYYLESARALQAYKDQHGYSTQPADSNYEFGTIDADTYLAVFLAPQSTVNPAGFTVETADNNSGETPVKVSITGHGTRSDLIDLIKVLAGYL